MAYFFLGNLSLKKLTEVGHSISLLEFWLYVLSYPWSYSLFLTQTSQKRIHFIRFLQKT